MSHRKICEASSKFTCSPELAPGHWPFAVPDGQTIEWSGLDLAHASLSARQAKKLGLLTSGTYGPPHIGLSASAGLSLSLANNLEALTQMTGSTLYKLTWKAWAMPSGRSRFRLRASVLRTSVTGLTGWPTPTAGSGKGVGTSGRQGGMNLQTAASLAGWPTPAANEFLPVDLDLLVQRRELLAQKNGNNGFGLTLGQAVPLLAGWPTPSATDSKGGYQGGRIRNGKLSTDRLDVVAQIAGPVRLTASGRMLTGSAAAMESGGQLNPALSLWLQGFPEEWASCAPQVTP